MKRKIISGILFAFVLMLGFSLVIASPAGANGGWSDNFDGGAQQTWVNVNQGTNSTFVVTNDRYQLHTEYQSPDGVVVSYVNSTATDVIVQAKVERIAEGDKFLAYLIVRGNVGENDFYSLGISSGDGSSNGPHLWLGKSDGATYTNLGGAGGSTLPWGAGNYDWHDCYIKFAAFGANLKGKVWKVGEAEPAGWQVTASDSSFTSGIGGVMVATYHTLGWGTVQVAFDDVSLSILSQSEVWVDDNWAGTVSGTEVESGKIFGYNAFATIQSAVDAASPDDTINVAAGTYAESLIDIDKAGLTISSMAGANDTIIDSDGMLYSFKVIADNVTITGFTIQKSGSSGICLGESNYPEPECLHSVTGCEVSNCIFKGIKAHGCWLRYCTDSLIDNNKFLEPSTGGAAPFVLLDLDSSGNVISNNEIFGNGTGGAITMQGGSNDNLIDNNIFTNPGTYGIMGSFCHNLTIINNKVSDSTLYGIFLGTCNNPTLDNNTVTGSTYQGIYLGEGSYQSGEGCDDAVLTNNTCTSNGYHGIDIRFSDNSTLSNNTCSSNTMNGIYVKALDNCTVSDNQLLSNGWAGLRLRSVTNSTVESNNVSENIQYGIWIEMASSNNQIIGNDILNNATGDEGVAGIRIDPADGSEPMAEPMGTHVHFNNIVGNTKCGISNTVTEELDATNNWWGSANGPEHAGNTFNVGSQGDKVTDNIDYCPWLDNEYPTGTSFAPVTSEDGGFSSIQAAIDAATATTITCAAGTYNENVVVDKSLTLQAGSSPVINGDTDDDGIPDGSCITVSANEVTIDGFELTNGYNGIIGETSNSTIQNCIIHDNLNYVGSNGVGILLWGDNDNNQILNNEIYNNDRQGVFIGFDSSAKISTGNTVSGNKIYDNGLYTQENGPDASAYGIQLWNADGNTIEDNEVFNHDDWFSDPVERPTFDFAQGIYLCASFNNIVTGNALHGNNYGIGFWSAGRTVPSPETTTVNFNNIAGNPGFGMRNYNTVVLDATNNWWGDASGPSGVGPGTGDAVSDNVDFEPWIGAETTNVVSEGVSGTGGEVPAEESPTSGAVTVSGSGIPDGTTVTVAEYGSNPGDSHSFRSQGYYDVYLNSTTGVEEVIIVFSPATRSTTIYYWDGVRWRACSNQAYNSGAIEVTITNDTFPSLADLSGLPFSSGRPPSGGDGGPSVVRYYLDTYLFGESGSLRISSAGRILETLEATSADGNLTIAIEAGTTARDKERNRLQELKVRVTHTQPSLPENTHIIGLAYDFSPDGASFSPPITLTWSYDPDDIPEGVAEEDLVIAYYDEEAGEWAELNCVVDTESNTITASVSHFTTFAVIAMPLSPPPPALAPADFSSSELSVFPSVVNIGEVVTISVLVTNTGEEEGSYTVTLKINGVAEQTREVTMAGGAEETVTFTVTGSTAGIYSVDVNGLTGSFTVKEGEVTGPVSPPPTPTSPSKINWAILGPILGVAIFLAIFLPIRLRRRRVG